MDIKEIYNKKNIFAVVGASDNIEKYGYKVYKMLKSNGYKVYPVNPLRETVQGDKTYKTIADLPERPNVISVITPPNISIEILKQAEKLEIPSVWFQPGAEDANLVEYAKTSPLDVIYGKCILIEKEKLDSEIS
jgi:uncharacterized protein